MPSKNSRVKKTPTAKYEYPSRFGSHSSMIVKDNEDGTSTLKDEFGGYTTPNSRINSGLSDSNRYASDRIAGKL